MSRTLTIRVPTDPSLAVTVRVFVAESARTFGVDQVTIEDLRLIATELLASAVEHGSENVELELDRADGAWRLTARGTGTLDGTPLGDLPFRRIDMLRGLAEIEQRNDEVIVTGPIDPGEEREPGATSPDAPETAGR